jgi:hypothetical protein
MSERLLFGRRSYQMKTWRAKRAGWKRFCEAIHRRGGKDRNWMSIIFEDMLEHPATYFHIFPALNQGRRDVWDNMITESSGKKSRMIDMFPQELGFLRNEAEMSITHTTTGARYQIMGAEDEKAIEKLRGPNPYGLVYSEAGFMNPKAWEVLSPVLAENGGWAAFISTPNVEDDWFHKLLKTAQADPERWFSQVLTVDDTRRDAVGENGGPVITPEAIEGERRDGKSEQDIQREYYCAFQGYQYGTIYGQHMMQAAADGRITRVPYDPLLPVGVVLDLGHSDHMAAWFYQIFMNKKLFIRYKEWQQKEIKDFARYAREETPYSFGRICLPWDGRAAANYLEEVHFKNVNVMEKRTASVWTSIQDCRRDLYTSYFDEVNCAIGIEHLKKYKAEYDEEKRVFMPKPIHDEHSHAADAYRTGTEVGWEPILNTSMFYGRERDQVKVDSAFDPRIPYGG